MSTRYNEQKTPRLWIDFWSILYIPIWHFRLYLSVFVKFLKVLEKFFKMLKFNSLEAISHLDNFFANRSRGFCEKGIFHYSKYGKRSSNKMEISFNEALYNFHIIFLNLPSWKVAEFFGWWLYWNYIYWNYFYKTIFIKLFKKLFYMYDIFIIIYRQ